MQEVDVWRFSVLGIDTSKMVMTHFGVGKGAQIANAYRRFYRANLKHHVGQLHRSQEGVNVIKTYHDEEGRLEADDWFSHHPQKFLQAERESVRFVDTSVTFVNSCHRKEIKHPQASHFIQLCDLLLGATRYVFEDVGSHLARDRVVNQITPLLERLNSSQQYKNVNSKYKLVDRASLGFFPSRKLTEESLDNEFARGQSSFFRDREMLQYRRVTGQDSLFD